MSTCNRNSKCHYCYTKNGKLMRSGQYVTCGKTKNQFLKKEVAGGSFLNSLVNKFPFEIHLPGHNFTGPGTKLNKRLNPNGTPKERACL